MLFLQYPNTILLKHTLHWYASHAYGMPKIVISNITNNDIIKLLFIYYCMYTYLYTMFQCLLSRKKLKVK